MGGLFVLCWIREILIVEVSLRALHSTGRAWGLIVIQSLAVSLGLYAFGGSLRRRIWASPLVVFGFLAAFVHSSWWQRGYWFLLWALGLSFLVALHQYLLPRRRRFGEDRGEKKGADEPILTPLSRRLLGLVVMGLSAIFLILVVLFHALIAAFLGHQLSDAVPVMASLYISVMNGFILGIVLRNVSLGAVGRLYYRDFCFLVGGLSLIAFSGLVYDLVLPLERFQGLRQESFIGYGGVLAVSFLLAFPTAWKTKNSLPPQSLDSSSRL